MTTTRETIAVALAHAENNKWDACVELLHDIDSPFAECIIEDVEDGLHEDDPDYVLSTLDDLLDDFSR